MKRALLRTISCLVVALMVLPAVAAEDAELKAIVPSDYLVLPAVGQYGRLLLHRDAVEAQLVAGTWKNPANGDVVILPDGQRETWQAATARDGTLDTASHRGGYAFTTFDAPADGVMLLEASGHAAVYVNGELHTGDPYKLGWLRLPVRVQKGENTLLFHLAADKLMTRLTPPPAGVFLADVDQTLPTLVRGETEPVWGAVPVVNASGEWLDDLQLECQAGEGETLAVSIAPLPPLSVRKVPFQLRAAENGAGEKVRYELRLMHADNDKSNDGDQPLDEADVELAVVGPEEVQVRTFVSRIDGSVQPYAARPAKESQQSEGKPGLILTLHGAGELYEAHAAKFAPKSWSHVVAPQGRRPFGFDWEAWSRIDAREALADAQENYPTDPSRVVLTGNSMGGHGVWHLGVTYPDVFAAIGPSDGWISFWSYGGGMPNIENPTAIEAMMLRGYAPSDTLKLLTNLTNTGVFVQHDPAEADVPVEQARFLREELAVFHPNFVYREALAGESESEEAGIGSPRMMEFFRDSERPPRDKQTAVDFTTADPGISAVCDWITIDAQEQQLVPSRVEMQLDRDARTFVGTTSNVARLAINVDGLTRDKPIDVTLDDQSFTGLPWPADGSEPLWFERKDDRWVAADTPAVNLKGRERYGTFNAALDDDVLLIYGTQGNEEENHWAEAKARFDAETFYYRANGALQVLPDTQFDEERHADHNVILYGNADTNSVWTKLLAECPVKVKRGQVRVGDRTESGDDLAVLMVRPRAGSDTALVGAVGGTSPAGMRLTNRLRWYVSGIVYPDLMILGPKILTEGVSDVRASGFFGPDWGTAGTEIAWRDETP